MTLPTAADVTGTEPAVLKLSHNTFVVDNSFQLIVQLGPKQTVQVDARGNIVDHHRIVQLYATRFPRGLLPDTATRRLSLLASIIHWSDDSNLYRRGQTLSLSSMLAPREAPKVDMLPLVDWLGIWQLTSPASAEARIHFQNRQTKETESPKLVRVEDASGPIPPSVGADPDRVGPRR